MGQIASHISGYFGEKPKNEEDKFNHVSYSRNFNDKKFFIQENKSLKDYAKIKISDGKSSLSSIGSFVTARHPLKRGRPSSPTAASVPESIIDIFSPAKKVKLDFDEFLDFPFLKHSETVDYYRKSKILIILRGLPGSGKSTIIKNLERKYCSIKVCSADHFFMKDGEYVYERELIKEAHAECQKNTIKAVEEQVLLVVIDNTNVKLWEMKFYLDLANEFNYVPVIVEPQTPWKRDVAVLAKKNTHEISEEIIQYKNEGFDELLPVYYGWFLNESDSVSILEEAQLWIEEAYKIREFREEFSYHTETSNLEDLLSYYKKPGSGHILHITAKYIGRALTDENREYTDCKEVQNAIGKSFDIQVVGFVLTPRTLGARMKLTNEQMSLWDKDDTEEVPLEFWEVLENSNYTEDEEEITEGNVSDKEVNGDACPEDSIMGNETILTNGSSSAINGNGDVVDYNEFVESIPHDESTVSLNLSNVSDDLTSTKTSPEKDRDAVSNGSTTDYLNSSNSVEVFQDQNTKQNGDVATVDEAATLPSQSIPTEGGKTPKMDGPPSPSKHQRSSPRKGGSSSPRKQKSGVQIPENTLNIDKSMTRNTWLGRTSVVPKKMKFMPTSGKGSRAHITLGCAPKVSAVTTGLDVIMAVQKEKIANEMTSTTENGLSNGDVNINGMETPPSTQVSTFSLSGGVARNYGNGVWVFYTEDTLVAQSVFSLVA